MLEGKKKTPYIQLRISVTWSSFICFKNPQNFQMYCLRQLKREETKKRRVSTVGNSSLTHRSKRMGKTHFSVLQPTYYLQ